MKKVFYAIGFLFTIPGLVLWLLGVPFIWVAKKCGHTYWQL